MTATVAIHEGRTDAAPEQVGLDSKRLHLLDRHFAALIAGGKLQGASYLVARNGQIALQKSMGKLTCKADSKDLLTDSVRKIYSITKIVTATAVMQLAEEGKLFLQQPVAEIIKAFDTNLHRGITIWHLLTHTAGIYGDGGQNGEPYSLPHYGWWAYEKKKNGGTLEEGEWARLLLSGPVRAKPGEEWTYNSAGFDVLAEIVSVVSGQPFEAYVQERLLGPLGMERSGFQVPEHLKQEACYTNDWQEKEIFDPHDRAGGPPPGGGGMYASLEDLWKFGQAMLDGGSFGGAQILGRRTIAMMTTNQLKNVRTSSWGPASKLVRHGLGFALYRDDLCTPGTYGHEGYGRCGLYIDPAEQLVFVYFVPTEHEWVPESLINPRAIVWSSII